MAREDDPPAAARITWDEAAIATHESEAGVLYGTQKVQEVATPFLYSGAETPAGASSSAGEGARDAPARTIGEHVPGVGRVEVDVGELRAAWGCVWTRCATRRRRGCGCGAITRTPERRTT